MHKTIVLALSAGFLAVAALQFPGAVLAKSGGRTVQLKSTIGGAANVPLTSRLPGQMAPSSVAKRPGGMITEPRPGEIGTGPGPGQFKGRPGPFQPLCHPPKLSYAQKTHISKLPPPKVCFGKLKGSWCYHCGGFPPAYGYYYCVTCKAGYSWNAASKLCCPGKPSVPIPK